MENLKDRITSRKFLLALGALAGYVLLGITGQVEWGEAFDKASYIVMAYIAAEGGADILGRFKK